MRIIIDAMGGDNAPAEIVKGAVRAKRELGVDIVLTGIEEKVKECLANEGCTDIPVVNTTEVITMDDDPSTAIRRKKNSSMAVALNMLRDGEADAMVSAGSTGALLTGATLTVKRIHGIRRAALAPVLPAGEHGVMLIDCGANVECTAEYLLQFAYMGSFYAKKIMGCDDPRIGLLNVGTEDSKGGVLQHQAFELLKKAHEEGRINFIGNIEGTDVFAGKADVVVTDGFTGNVLLKTTEGAIKYIMKSLKGVFYKNTVNKLAAAVLKSDLAAMKKSMDVNEVGGTAMIGISKPVIKAHGSSNADSIFAAVRQTIAFVESGIIGDIKENIEYMKLKSE
ncbi:MAG: phosphate acyltransferase PlsX [Oscillospiraceae bacterium]|nr:phosphate acyltransferase PlsX [Oscillospiraceae bacterium]